MIMMMLRMLVIMTMKINGVGSGDMIILCFWVMTSVPVTDTMGKGNDE